MLNLRYRSIVSLFIAVLIPASARAAVTLAFVDQDGTNNGSVNVAPNGTFNVRLNLIASTAAADRTTGLGYYLTVLGAGSGYFRIQDRNISTSTYSDFTFGDAVVEALPSALLDPQNNDDLGAGVNDVMSPNGGGTFLVAIFTIKVDPATPLSVYSLQTISDPGTGWSDAGFEDREFAQHANYTIVVPEPTGGALAACGAAGLLLRGRRRSARVV